MTERSLGVAVLEPIAELLDSHCRHLADPVLALAVRETVRELGGAGCDAVIVNSRLGQYNGAVGAGLTSGESMNDP